MGPSRLTSTAGWLCLLLMLALGSTGVNVEPVAPDASTPPALDRTGR